MGDRLSFYSSYKIIKMENVKSYDFYYGSLNENEKMY